MRIIGIVEHDKAGIDRRITLAARHAGARVPPQIRLGLVQGDCVLVTQHMGCAHP